MLTIDTHCHASPYSMEPIETLLYQMDSNEVDKAVLIQFRGAYDNSYLIDCVKNYPGTFSAVVIVDVAASDGPQKLEQWVGQGAEGIRLAATDRSPGDDPLEIWRKADELGVAVSVLASVEDYAAPAFEAMIKELPNLKIVIEHLGGVGAYWGPGRPDPMIPMETYKKVLALAQYPNTYMKVHGFGEFCARPVPLVQPMPFLDVPPLSEMAFGAFGASRLMWGSDFPPVAGREGYTNALKFPMEGITFQSEEDKEWLFGKTAATLWKFPG